MYFRVPKDVRNVDEQSAFARPDLINNRSTRLILLLSTNHQHLLPTLAHLAFLVLQDLKNSFVSDIASKRVIASRAPRIEHVGRRSGSRGVGWVEAVGVGGLRKP
ncbi:hypothetical protein GALMADRAFT_138514 [Galerina marginata CBS 339.88]|uniref:Uncharacterized protein n=1 Tax=Galerina marginata (strain CBS 339.88) TaxID=685588 RepID=A0A067TEK0_GALM3|nr:hypothetical protein GALMADRAFT_138514 [Galerina marginata CBS 339.88]